VTVATALIMPNFFRVRLPRSGDFTNEARGKKKMANLPTCWMARLSTILTLVSNGKLERKRFKENPPLQDCIERVFQCLRSALGCGRTTERKIEKEENWGATVPVLIRPHRKGWLEEIV